MQCENAFRVSLFHVGPQKAATTWLYQCLRHHPQMIVPARDSVHFFDMHYYKGCDWYHAQFDWKPDASSVVAYDPTPSYLRSPLVARRIKDYNPSARVALTLRNPIERAFSHYWHEKKKRTITFSFGDVLDNYDLFSSWVEPGLYSMHIERFRTYFDSEQILFLSYDEIAEAPADVIRQICRFARIDDGYFPSTLDERVNGAGFRKGRLRRVAKAAATLALRLGWGGLHDAIHRSNVLSGKGEYHEGPPRRCVRQVFQALEDDIEQTERLSGLDLTSWKRNPWTGEAF